MGEPSRPVADVVTIRLPHHVAVVVHSTHEPPYGFVREAPHRFFARTSDDISWCLSLFKLKDGGWGISARTLPGPAVWDSLQRVPPISTFDQVRQALSLLRADTLAHALRPTTEVRP